LPGLSFRIESVRAERYSFEPVPSLNMNVQILVSRVEREVNGFRANFLVKLDCVPPIASIDIKGVVYVVPQNEAEKQQLEKDLGSGAVPPQLTNAIYSYTLPILALLSRELGLPPPCPPPIQIPKPERREPKPGYHL